MLVGLGQILFLSQAARTGFNGWDDWGLAVTYDAFHGNNPGSFLAIAKFYGSPYLWSEAYNIGIIKNVFGLNQTVLVVFEIFVKSLAGLSVGYLVLRLTRDKIYAGFAVFLFCIFASTAGPLDHVIFIGAYGMIIFGCLATLDYVSTEKRFHLIFSSLWFFIAILLCPSRAYLIVPVPLLVELYYLLKTFNIKRFIMSLAIFYFPLVVLQGIMLLNGDQPHQAFMPQLDVLSRIEQVSSGNLYSLTLPFQAISSLFIDVSFVQEILGNSGSILFGFIKVNLILFCFSIIFGWIIREKSPLWFGIKLTGITILIEAIFYWFGLVSGVNGQVSYLSSIKFVDPYSQNLVPSIFQASFGVYYVVLGVLMWLRWRQDQRKNRVLGIALIGWGWSVFSEILIYLTSHWYGMLDSSIDRYIIACSAGAVVFIGGIFTLAIRAINRLEKPSSKTLLYSLIGMLVLLIAWKNYTLLDRFFYTINEVMGGGSYWQDMMYDRFVDEFGENNLKKPILLYVDSDSNFDHGSFIYPARFRLFYNKNGDLVEGVCRAVTTDVKELQKGYAITNSETGFVIDSICTNSGLTYEKVFYPLADFYAYKIENKNFIDIRQTTLEEINSAANPEPSVIVSKARNNFVIEQKWDYPGSFFYKLKLLQEKLSMLVLFTPEGRVNYAESLVNERLLELKYTVETNSLSEIEPASRRYAYQAGVLTNEVIMHNKGDKKTAVIKKFEKMMPLLAYLRDHFEANSPYWLLIQDDINTLRILSDQLKN